MKKVLVLLFILLIGTPSPTIANTRKMRGLGDGKASRIVQRILNATIFSKEACEECCERTRFERHVDETLIDSEERALHIMRFSSSEQRKLVARRWLDDYYLLKVQAATCAADVRNIYLRLNTYRIYDVAYGKAYDKCNALSELEITRPGISRSDLWIAYLGSIEGSRAARAAIDRLRRELCFELFRVQTLENLQPLVRWGLIIIKDIPVATEDGYPQERLARQFTFMIEYLERKENRAFEYRD